MKLNHILSLGALWAASTISATAVNVIADPGFETGSTGLLPDSGGVNTWSAFQGGFSGTLAIQNTTVRTGAQALQITTGPEFAVIYTNTGNSLTTGDVENQNWNYSFWVFSDGTGEGAFNFVINSSNELNQNVFGASGTVTAASLTPSTWTEFSGSFATTDEAPDRNRMKFDINGFTGNSTFFVDDVTLTNIPEPSTALALLAGVGLLAGRRRVTRGA